ncbi:MAG TPA: GNAT family N-acetyltransferase [Solirubrobacteraceae bacterium]|nr:GNAT family N-acetyltransferase [Solirubrobacteraceae bacterium]
MVIRRCLDSEREAILAVINEAAEAYRGVIPPDRWHEPYFPRLEFDEAIASGVAFWGCSIDGELAGVMGIQQVGDVELIRHAYVVPARQGFGLGGALLEHLMRRSTSQVLVGTWAAADWAIRFYQRHGFELVAPSQTADLLRRYWSIPERQIETSVVLARPPLAGG